MSQGDFVAGRDNPCSTQYIPGKNGETSRCGCGFQKLASIHPLCYLSASQRIGAAKATPQSPSPKTLSEAANSLQPGKLTPDFHDPIPANQEYNPDRTERNCQPVFRQAPDQSLPRWKSIAAGKASQSPIAGVDELKGNAGYASFGWAITILSTRSIIFEVYLASGLIVDRHADFNLPDTVPT